MKLQPGPDDRGLRLDVFLARHLENLKRSKSISVPSNRLLSPPSNSRSKSVLRMKIWRLSKSRPGSWFIRAPERVAGPLFTDCCFTFKIYRIWVGRTGPVLCIAWTSGHPG